MKVFALLTAGGVGNRMGQDIPKQFMTVDNVPVIIYTLQAFQNHPAVDAICVPCLSGWEVVLQSYANQYGITKLQWICQGGSSNQESIFNGLMALKEAGCDDEDIVLIHDGVRPLVSEEIITNNTYKKTLTASELEFTISYDSDIRKAMRIIHGVVETSRYTVPYTDENPEGKNAAVYITNFGDSSVKLRTVIWAHNSDDSFMAKSDILFRVKKAFEENGVEIPYPFMNVVQRDYIEREISGNEPGEEKPDIKDKKMARILDKADDFSKANGLSRKDSGQVRLLTEEAVILLRKATGKTSIDFWPRILKKRAELSFFVSVQDIRHMSSIWDLTPEKQNGILRRIREMLMSRDKRNEEWSMSGDSAVNEDALERSILENLADDIRISVQDQKLKLTIIKELSV